MSRARRKTNKPCLPEGERPYSERLLEMLKAPSPRPQFTSEQEELLRQWFADNPEAEHAYLFYDGSVRGGLGIYGESRTGQLVSIAFDGFPVIVYREWLTESR